MEATVIGFQTVLSMLSLEALKQLVFKMFPTFTIDSKWYTVILPVLGLAVLPVASWLAGGAFSFGIWTEDMLRQTLVLVVTTLGSMFLYNNTLRKQ